GVGSVFSLTVPTDYIAVEEELPALVEALTGESDGGKIPLLVIEDEPETRLLYEKYLRETNFRVIPAAGLRRAREVMRQLRPGAVILDILLRGEDSWQWLSQMKAAEETKNIPVLVATTVEDPNKGLALGADAYLVKPISRQQLIGKLNDLLPPATPLDQNVRRRRQHRALKTVLVVDDEESARYLLRRFLSEFPVHVTEATNGMEGLRLAAEQRPEAIFLDLKMPGMSGSSVLEILKTDPATRDIPVIIITSETPLSEEQSRINTTAQGLIKKEDLTPEALEKALQGIRLDIPA
ncbi:MAG TPA: response regulator, partial [Candidatus Binatia bacterium]|nr:response regulator [Candidatus Binatia bacterium]